MSKESKQKPKEKPKRKRKNDDGSLMPYLVIFGAVIVLLIGGAAAFLLLKPEEEICQTNVECDFLFATPTPLPFSLFPTVTPTFPAMPPNSAAQSQVVTALALSPDDSQLVVGLMSRDGRMPATVVTFGLTYGEGELPVISAESQPYNRIATGLRTVDSIVFHPYSELVGLASIVDNRVDLFDLMDDDGSVISPASIEGYSPLGYDGYTQVAFSPDGRYFALGGASGLRLMDTSLTLLDEINFVGEPMPVQIAFDNDSSRLIVAHTETMTNNMSPYVQIYDLADDTLTRAETHGLAQYITEIAVHPTLNQVAVTTPNLVTIIDLDSGDSASYSVEIWQVTAMAYDPTGGALHMNGLLDGMTTGVGYALPLADGFGIPTSDGTINMNPTLGTFAPVSAMVFTPDGTKITAPRDNRIEFWDTAVGRPYTNRQF